ncbi:MAG TPA: VOC family protein [Caulobacteraceae bacterium]|jgi:catechol 2,3-dioxygenase-like lactoylglutathione lyase family enzyme
MLSAIDHVQIAIPVGAEDAARPFYRDVLGLTETPKPADMAARGGIWFEHGPVHVHLGVEKDFRANVKAHVAFRVDDVPGLIARATAAGFKASDEPLLDGYDQRAFLYDPFGNRLEFLRPIQHKAA